MGIQQLLDETNQRLQRMDEDYTCQSAQTKQVISQLEQRIQQLTNESAQNMQDKQKLEGSNQLLKMELETLRREFSSNKLQHDQIQADLTSQLKEKHDKLVVTSQKHESLMREAEID